MPERYFSLPSGGAYLLTDATLSALLETGSGDAARVFLYLLRRDGSFNEKSLCDDLDIAVPALSGALSALQKAGLLSERLSPNRLPSDTRPDYSGYELGGHIDKDPAFRHIVDEIQRRLGRVLSTNDLQVLFGLYDWRGFSPGVISLLVSYCLEEAERRWGPGRFPTLRQIDKQAAQWERDGIRTEEQAEQYIHDKEAARKTTALIYHLMGITGRSPSPSEIRYVSEWAEMGLSPEAIALAYDKTVLRTGSLNWKYMHSIIKRWKDKELLTVEDIEAGDARPDQAVSSARTELDQAPTAPISRNRQAAEKMKRFVQDDDDDWIDKPP